MALALWTRALQLQRTLPSLQTVHGTGKLGSDPSLSLGPDVLPRVNYAYISVLIWVQNSLIFLAGAIDVYGPKAGKKPGSVQFLHSYVS